MRAAAVNAFRQKQEIDLREPDKFPPSTTVLKRGLAFICTSSHPGGGCPAGKHVAGNRKPQER